MSAPYLSADATVSARRAVEVVTSNTVTYTEPTRGVYIGTTGNLKVDMVSGGTVTFVSVPAGSLLPVQVERIYATGTTATNIIALY
jgi:hypothetical protein